MNHFYLKNLSIEVALANAGFNAKHWDAYQIPRSRGATLHDQHIKHLIEFLFPTLLYQHSRAKATFDDQPLVPNDLWSVTNNRFLENIVNITFFWLQDAVVLLDHFPDLCKVPPWHTILADVSAASNFEMLRIQVRHHQQGYHMQHQSRLLHQDELFRAIRDACVLNSTGLDLRLARQTSQLQQAVMTKVMPKMMKSLHKHMTSTMRSVLGNMYRAAAEASYSQEYPDDGNSDHDEHLSAHDNLHNPHPHAESHEDQPPSSVQTPASSVQHDFAPQQPTHHQQGCRSERPTPHHAPPTNPSPLHETVRAQVIMVERATEQRSDGFYLGNDLKSVSDVWDLKSSISSFIADTGNASWWTKSIDPLERAEQKRLRERRNVVWNAIQHSAQLSNLAEHDVVKKLQEMQNKFDSGITRVEAWARLSLKQSSSILDIASAYVETKHAKMACDIREHYGALRPS